MRHFGVDDEDEFYATAERLQEEMREWLVTKTDLDAEAYLDARLILDWKWGYGDGQLDILTRRQIDEFLLEWCPRKLSFPPDTWLPIVDAVRCWVLFLIETDLWRGGPVDPLLNRLDTIAPEFIDAMGNPDNFGMAKGLFAGGAAATGIIPNLDDPDSIAELMEAFNDLPFEDRKAITDQFLPGNNFGDGFNGQQPLQLPLAPEPDPADVEAAVAAAPILGQVAAVRAHLGTGKKLTATFNPKVADAKAYAAVLEATDLLDTDEPVKHTVRSASDLPHTMYLLEAIEAAEAIKIEIDSRTMRPGAGWETMTDLERLSELFQSLYACGPITSMGIQRDREADMLLEDGFGHWVVPLLYGDTIDLDELTDIAVQTLDESGLLTPYLDAAAQRESTARKIEHSFDITERCGLITRTGERRSTDSFGNPVRRGGVVRATPSGQLVLRYAVTDAGYAVGSMTELRDLDALDLLDTIATGVAPDSETLWLAWRPEASDADKSHAIVQAMVECGNATGRLNALELLANAPDAAIDPLEALENGPLSGHAVAFLAEHGEVAEPSDPDGPMPILSLVVDLLASDLEIGPGALLERWDTISNPVDSDLPTDAMSEEDRRRACEALLDDLWRVQLPETAVVLEALGKHLPDSKLAKAARKAMFKNRSASN